MDATELLDIKQAAALLHVSETSLRRWTNAGRLRSFRVGGRRERRFRRADLLALLEEHPAGGGIPFASGTHACALYTSDLARAEQAVEFLADGLHEGSVCFVVATPAVRRRIFARLERRRPGLQGDIAAGRVVPSQYAGTAAAQLEFWDTQLSAAIRAGARSLRVLGDVSGGRLARTAAFWQVLEYEVDYQRLVARRFPVVTLCQYDARALSGLEASQVLQHHSDTLRYPVERVVR